MTPEQAATFIVHMMIEDGMQKYLTSPPRTTDTFLNEQAAGIPNTLHTYDMCVDSHDRFASPPVLVAKIGVGANGKYRNRMAIEYSNQLAGHPALKDARKGPDGWVHSPALDRWKKEQRRVTDKS